jgi:hypothetical protein
VKSLLASLYDHPRLVSVLGTVSGWFSVEHIARAKDFAQLAAAGLAMLVSVCALILTGPQALAKLRAWWAAWRRPRQRNFNFEP